MPAINLPRLNKQIENLLQHTDQPDAFWAALSDLLELYTNRTARALPHPGAYLPSHHVPPQVLHEIERALAPLAANAPQRVQAIILRLWKENQLEAHLLAARLLGRIPVAADNWLDIVTAWLTATRDPRVRAALLKDTLRPLRTEAPAQFLRLIQTWLKGDTPSPGWAQALTALTYALQESGTEHLPEVFALLPNVLRNAAPQIQPQLADLLSLLYEKSPPETRYFLSETLPSVQLPRARRTLRRMASRLPPELRGLIRKHLSDS